MSVGKVKYSVLNYLIEFLTICAVACFCDFQRKTSAFQKMMICGTNFS